MKVSNSDINWALQLEHKVKTKQYEPAPAEKKRYQNIANQLQDQVLTSKPKQGTAQASVTLFND